MISHDYPSLYQHLADLAPVVPSRAGDTREELGVTFLAEPGRVPRRTRANYNIGFMELAQLLAGTYDPAAIARVAPNAQHALFTPQMAYGPRVAPQMPAVIRALSLDPLTRQAVVMVAGQKDGPGPHIPCTLSVQFLLREGALHCVVGMRSWDIIKGLTYDLIMFGGLQQVVANCLNVATGFLQVNAGSAHLYTADLVRGCRPVGGHLEFKLYWPVATVWNTPPLEAWDMHRAAAARAITSDLWGTTSASPPPEFISIYRNEALN